MSRKNHKSLATQQPPTIIDGTHRGGTSVGEFFVGLFLVTAVVTPALIALSPYNVSVKEVLLTSPFIIASQAIMLAGGCFLYERYGLKHTRFSWLSAFFTFALPGSILYIIGFTSFVKLLPRASAPDGQWPSVFLATLLLSFVFTFFIFFGIVIIKPPALDKRKRVVILVILGTLSMSSLLDESDLVHLLATVAGITAGLWMARWLGKSVGPRLLALRSLWPYIQVMLAPTATFVLGYLMIAFIFAGFMGALYRLDHASFVGIHGEPSFFVFFYYALVTMTTVGYGDIAPASSAARLLSSAAALKALCWVTVVFAAVIAFLQPRFARILKEGNAR